MISQILKCQGGIPQFSPPHDNGEGGEYKPIENCAKKRRVCNLFRHMSTWLRSAVTSVTTPLAIEVVKDKDSQNGPTHRSIKIEGQKGVKNKGTAPAAHTTAPARSDCLAVKTCCKCGPTFTCKTVRCDFRKASRVSGAVCQCRAPKPTGRATDEARTTQRTDKDRKGKWAEWTHKGG